MRIGSDDRYLSPERVGQEGPTVVSRIAAAVTGAGCVAAAHGRTKVRAPTEASGRLADFKAHRVQQLELILSQRGWLRIKREAKGRTLVRYRRGSPAAAQPVNLA